MPDIRNTTSQDPIVHLAGSLIEGTDGYIEGMEAAGQRELVHSDLLPADADWPEFEALGFVKGDPVPDDDLFVNVTLPPGWSKQGSDHSMGSFVVDERGVKRVSVFYKAAFYDRRADMQLINPGANLATDAIYGTDEPVLPAVWDVLTDDEKDDFSKRLARYSDDARQHPDIYGDRLPRVAKLIDLMNEAILQRGQP